MSQTYTTGTNTPSAGSLLSGFVNRYWDAQDEAAARRALDSRKGKKREFDNLNKFAVDAARENEMVADRLENGFRLAWTRTVAGRERQPFTEKGLRSTNNALMKLFISRVPKGGRARASEDKANLYVPYRRKMLVLDCPYIEMTPEALGLIRLDCDAVFASPAACQTLLRELVASGTIPHMPHFIVGDVLPNGTFSRPHFLILLAPGGEVWNSKTDERCRRQPVRLFDGVCRGWAKALLPYGVDPAAPRLTQRTKNPVSPYLNVITSSSEETKFMTLSEYAKVLDTRASMEELVRRAAAVQSGMGLKPSNEAFNVLRQRGKEVLRDWHFSADPRMRNSREDLATDLYFVLDVHAKEVGLTGLEVTHVISKVATYLSGSFDASKLQSPRKVKHRLLHEVQGVEGVRERQQIGARYSAAARKEKSLQKLVVAYQADIDQSQKISKERLASRAGVDRATAYRLFEECQQICRSRAVDKKGPLNSPSIEEPAVEVEPEATIAASPSPPAPVRLAVPVDERLDDLEQNRSALRDEMLEAEMEERRQSCSSDYTVDPDDDDIPW